MPVFNVKHNARCDPKLISHLTSAWLAVLVLACGGITPHLGAQSLDGEQSAETLEWFEREVRPLLAEHCLSCHSSSLAAPKANLKLDRRELALTGGDSGPAIVPGKPQESLVIQALRGQGLTSMPPDKPLSKVDIAKLERWIQLGAPWPESTSRTAASGPDWLINRTQTHWAWQPVREPTIPPFAQAEWPARPLDAFVIHQLESAGLAPNESAAAEVLLRRLAFDLTGLPPTREQVSELASAADKEQAYARAVDRLLAAPGFGISWGRHWLDLVRYCETLGHEFDYPIRHAWRYRDAVIDSLNCDISYAQFVRDHVAGDRFTPARVHPLSGVNQSLALTGWWWMGEGLHAPVDVWGDEATRLDNQIDVYSKTFLGMTLACARCHDHKFDALGMSDYTSLLGILQSSRRTYAPLDKHGQIANHNQQVSRALLARWQDYREQHRGDNLSQATVRTWIEQVTHKLRSKLDDSRKALPLSHPLYSLLTLAEAGSPDEFSQQRTAQTMKLHAAASQFAAWKAESPLLASFAQGMPAGWYVETADPGVAQAAVNPTDTWLLEPSGPLPARDGSFASFGLGKQQQLALRSPTFTLTHPMVALRMRGKSAQSTVVVDNFFMIEFHGLLFGDLRKPIDQPSDQGWVVHAGDLDKYAEHPAYISIEDDENGWFELSEVRQCQTAPPIEPHPLTLAWLTEENCSAEQLQQRLAETLIAGWQHWLSGAIASNDASATRLSPEDIRSQRELLRAAITEGQRLEIPFPLSAIDRQDLEQLAAATPAPIRVIASHDGTPRNAVQFVRGNPHVRGDEVPRGELQALGGETFTSPTSSGREELAEHLTSGRHPLAARVMVNRVWLHLFGQGLVDSPDNFGLLGGAPSNLELLDYLSTRFVEHDWSIKWLVREICLSRAYRLSSQPTAAQRELDPAARLLSHRSVRRVTAEQLRDSLLAISGSLDGVHSGESIPVYLTPQMTGRGRPGRSGPLDGAGRRSIFVEIRRNFLDPFLVAFDQPPPATTVGKRNLSNVPAQSLSMLNDPLVHEMAKRWSEVVMKEATTPTDRVRSMFLSALSREPSAEELNTCIVALQATGDGKEPAEQRLMELAHVLMCTKEFQYLQ